MLCGVLVKVTHKANRFADFLKDKLAYIIFFETFLCGLKQSSGISCLTSRYHSRREGLPTGLVPVAISLKTTSIF